MDTFYANKYFIKTEYCKDSANIKLKNKFKQDKTLVSLEILADENKKSIIFKVYLKDVIYNKPYIYGQAICMNGDIFDLDIGFELAYNRAKVKQLERMNVTGDFMKELIKQNEEMEDLICDITERLNVYFNNVD